MSTTKVTAREAFLAHVEANGWTLDPTAKIALGHYPNHRMAQDPHVFVRPAAHGGQWRIALDYNETSGYRFVTGNTLRGVSVAYLTPEGLEDRNRNVGRLRTPTKYSYDHDALLWNALSQMDVNGTHATLRQRAELLVTDPDLVMWLAAERQERSRQRDREQTAARRADLDARRQPLPVLVTEYDYVGLGATLTAAAREVAHADGKTDLPAALAALKAAVAAIDAVVVK